MILEKNLYQSVGNKSPFLEKSDCRLSIKQPFGLEKIQNHLPRLTDFMRHDSKVRLIIN
jgi:hypothetical protein